jgi:hypothetical protein
MNSKRVSIRDPDGTECVRRGCIILALYSFSISDKIPDGIYNRCLLQEPQPTPNRDIYIYIFLVLLPFVAIDYSSELEGGTQGVCRDATYICSESTSSVGY